MVCESKHPGLRVEESELDATELRHSAGFVNIGFGGIKSKTTVCHMSLLRSQRFPGVGEVWQDYHDDDSNKDRKSAFDDVELRFMSAFEWL